MTDHVAAELEQEAPMSPRTPAPDVTAEEVRAELLDRLGLPATATDTEVHAAYRALVAVLDRQPEDPWAQSEKAEISAVYSLLQETTATVPVVTDAAPATPKARFRPSKVAWVVAAVVVLAGAVFGFHVMTSNSIPGIDGAPDPAASSSAPTVDQAKVGALMQKITANPKDTASLSALADIYFQAQDFKVAGDFSQKVLALDPKNVNSWLALGASQFNLGDNAAAEKSWLKVVALNPKNAEAHYDLGFLYLSADKPDMAKVRTEWEKVVAIDPTSDIAKSVKTHLDSLTSASPTPVAAAK